ncbi:MAG: methylenetetrahydrofolate reductase [Alphaproteobacteria bacterium]|jgi:methylenetetrahydrofolate reductase (NADPH)|nr:methylenetetrahydrofolate reductase [Alphaproteobacteria bacterium]MBP9867541.1 methylenetetrahydrofolate reductase [Alphaproteobacteria bacterium]
MRLPSLSFEFFPPKTDKAREDLRVGALKLATLSPKFMTVTYGAAGSTREGTFEICKELAAQTSVPMGSHLTYLGSPKEELFEYVDQLWASGIHHLVALRGDIPVGVDLNLYKGEDYFQYTSDFVEALLARYPFDVSVGAYPEKHPDAPSMEADLEALRKKCAAGAARAVTQFFFDNTLYYDFLEKAACAGITTPIIPGLMPIGDLGKIEKFAASCGASVPDFVRRRFSGYEGDPQKVFEVGRDLLTEQVADLVRHGVSHLHFYTLNRPDLTYAACVANGFGQQNT